MREDSYRSRAREAEAQEGRADPPSRESDRRRADLPSGRHVKFTSRGAKFQPPFEMVTSVAVIPVTDDGQIVVARLPRGLDIPGGHVQEGETSPEETARREVMEEVRAKVGKLKVVDVVESDLFGRDPADLTYMVIYVAPVEELLEDRFYVGSGGRRVLNVKEFLDEYHAGNPDKMRRWISVALRAPEAQRVKGQ